MLRRERELVGVSRKVDGCVHSPARACDDISAIPRSTRSQLAPERLDLSPYSGKARTMPDASIRTIAGTGKCSGSRVPPGL
jgi:hypothetical protein